jgi:hypothetical protein
MKPTQVTKNRKAEREADVALMDCKDEFGSVLDIEDVLGFDYEVDFNPEEDD